MFIACFVKAMRKYNYTTIFTGFLIRNVYSFRKCLRLVNGFLFVYKRYAKTILSISVRLDTHSCCENCKPQNAKTSDDVISRYVCIVQITRVTKKRLKVNIFPFNFVKTREYHYAPPGPVKFTGDSCRQLAAAENILKQHAGYKTKKKKPTTRSEHYQSVHNVFV